ncbi:MAG: hypothetical protein A2174_02235, partial [Candidatus Portnoybacteria bacterium RBG_13_41_18]
MNPFLNLFMSYCELIENLISNGYLKTPKIISAFKKIDRADFVPDDIKHEAYVDAPLPIGYGQTISQPLTVAFMIEHLAPERGDKILEIGSGSGWQTAILAEIVGPAAAGGKIFAVELIDKLISNGYLKTPKIISAFKKIDRADFVPDDIKHEAYVDAPLPIGYGQTISQPLTVAFMIEHLAPERGDKILEIGSGSGWQTAILAEIVGPAAAGGKIFAVELIDKLFEFGRNNVEKYKFLSEKRAEFFHSDGSLGLLEQAPFDKIIAAASAAAVPQAWKDQLKIGGRIVAPVLNSIFLLTKKGENQFQESEFPGFAFVPLVSDQD